MRIAVYLNDYLDRIFTDWTEARRHGRQMHFCGYEVRYVTYAEGQHVRNRID